MNRENKALIKELTEIRSWFVGLYQRLDDLGDALNSIPRVDDDLFTPSSEDTARGYIASLHVRVLERISSQDEDTWEVAFADLKKHLEVEEARQRAIAKLSPKDRELLGL